jgi:DNA repair exonuclease SbcCD ATPase subunit
MERKSPERIKIINFKSISYRNFLSAGDKPVEINFCAAPTTLVVGPNGAGKSSPEEALSFALFGKPYRDIKKHQLINSINNRDCEVIVEFDIAKSKYKVIRGMKPNKFEIWQNGALLNQESHSRDYQKVLEQNILKLNYKSFHQIVVLGSASFVPFMQLPTSTRREVIEDLLDIGVFTKMNQLLKEKAAVLREQLGAVSHEDDLVSEKILMQKRHIGAMEARDMEQAQKHQEKLVELDAILNGLLEINEKLAGEMAEEMEKLDPEQKKLSETQKQLFAYQAQINNNIDSLVKEAKFYDDNSICPKCSQPLAEAFKTEKMHDCRNRAKKLMDGKVELEDKINSVQESINKLNYSISKSMEKNVRIVANNARVKDLRKQLNEINDDVTPHSNELVKAKDELAELEKKSIDLNSQKSSFYTQGTYNNAIGEMLRDTGIKTKVIRQYLPIMNKLINQYLAVLDFFVSFNLNENFEETLKSRHRDEFSYTSFSEGEKARIDLALLFTWRQIARMKNSASTNLLILDETFDSSLDGDGVENLLKILGTLEPGTNVFIISHKTDVLDGKFSRKLIFEKKNNFSSVTEGN